MTTLDEWRDLVGWPRGRCKVLGKLGTGSGDSIKIFSILKFYLCKQLRKALAKINPVQ